MQIFSVGTGGGAKIYRSISNSFSRASSSVKIKYSKNLKSVATSRKIPSPAALFLLLYYSSDILKIQVFCEKLVCLKQRIRAPDFCLKKAKSSLYILFSTEGLEVVCSSKNLEFSRETAHFGLFLLQV